MFDLTPADIDKLDLGPCCICQATSFIRNIIGLNFTGPTPGKGWGCLTCGLPPNGVLAVLCDDCLEAYSRAPDIFPLKFICTGYPASDGRTPIETINQTKFKHNLIYHPEIWNAPTWFDDSPDYGDPACHCSYCNDLIPTLDDLPDDLVPLRIFRETNHSYGQEARFCPDCVPAALLFLQKLVETRGINN